MPKSPAVSRDEVGENCVRLFCMVMASVAWKGEFNAAGLLSLSEEVEDYAYSRKRDMSETGLAEQIMGLRKK